MHQKVLHSLFSSHNITTGPIALQHQSCIQASNTTDCTISDVTPSSKSQFYTLMIISNLQHRQDTKGLGFLILKNKAACE